MSFRAPFIATMKGALFISEKTSRTALQRDSALPAGWLALRTDEGIEWLERTILSREGDSGNQWVFRDDQPIVSLVLPGMKTTADKLWQDLDESLAGDEKSVGDPAGA
jgi:hypothetical protein